MLEPAAMAGAYLGQLHLWHLPFFIFAAYDEVLDAQVPGRSAPEVEHDIAIADAS
jgi:hypothetical protein